MDPPNLSKYAGIYINNIGLVIKKMNDSIALYIHWRISLILVLIEIVHMLEYCLNLGGKGMGNKKYLISVSYVD